MYHSLYYYLVWLTKILVEDQKCLYMVIFTKYVFAVNIYINIAEVGVILVGFVIRGKMHLRTLYLYNREFLNGDHNSVN